MYKELNRSIRGRMRPFCVSRDSETIVMLYLKLKKQIDFHKTGEDSSGSEVRSRETGLSDLWEQYFQS